ncbi:MAG: nucleotide exchange factor GrpE [Thermoleophilia bacterium]
MINGKKRIPIVNHHEALNGAHVVDPASDPASGTSEVVAGCDDDGAVGPAAPADGAVSDDTPAEVALAPEDVVTSEAALLAEVTAERDGYLDSLRRLQAEFDNFRRRSLRESTEARTRARCSLLGEFLTVFDNLARALDAAEHHQEGKVLEGVRLTHSLFGDLLRREGVEEIHPLGSAFDPNLHEAIVALPSPEAEGTVIQVVEKGYAAGATVLRPARVAVSAGDSAVPGER